MLKRLASVAAFSIAIFAVATASASASTQIGQDCVTTGGSSGNIISDTNQSLPTGVITSWGYNYQPGTGPINYKEALVILQPGSPGTWSVISSTALPLQFGGDSGNVRVPIKAGQRVALWSDGAAFACPSSGGKTMDTFDFGGTMPQAGNAFAFSTFGAPVVMDLYATVEPDADGDGYGDETQDKCPQSPAFQTACPTPKLSAVQIPYAKGFRADLVTDFPGTVSATGSVRLPKSKGRKAKTLTFKSAAPVASTPGAFTQLTLKWPRALSKALKSLSKKQKLTVTVTLTSPGVLSSSTQTFKIKLAGAKR